MHLPTVDDPGQSFAGCLLRRGDNLSSDSSVMVGLISPEQVCWCCIGKYLQVLQGSTQHLAGAHLTAGKSGMQASKRAEYHEHTLIML